MKIFGENSARILLMSATPITDDPFNFISLLNLTDTKDIPEIPTNFIDKYLDKDTLKFTNIGKDIFKENIVGRVSYLNRMKDIRQFAQPIIHNINVNISEPVDISNFLQEIENYEKTIDTLKDIKVGDTKKLLISNIDETYVKPLLECDKFTKIIEKKSCVSQLKKEIKYEKDKIDEIVKIKVSQAKDEIIKNKDTIKNIKINIKNIKKNDNSILSVLHKKCFKKIT